MKILARILPGILGLAFLAVGLLFMFNAGAEAVLDRLQLQPTGIEGWAAIRSFIGGTFVGMAILLIHGVMKSRGEPIRMVGILLAVAVIGRIVSLVLDGISTAVIGPIVIEIVLVAICFYSANTLLQSDTV